MWSRNNTKCLMGRHVTSSFVYKREEYTYCVRCGKISLNHSAGSVDYPELNSQHSAGAKSGMMSIMSVSK